MKENKPNKTRQISLYMTEEMYNFLATQENTSAYIRKAIDEKRANDANPIMHANVPVVTRTTHRASFEYGNNEFAQEQAHNVVNYTGDLPGDSVVTSIEGKIYLHNLEGYHPDCVICRARKVSDLAGQS